MLYEDIKLWLCTYITVGVACISVITHGEVLLSRIYPATDLLPSIPQRNHSFDVTPDLRGFSWHQRLDFNTLYMA